MAGGRRLVRLARELKMSVIAEGIETDEQRIALTECGVGEGQGYLVSPPLPIEKFLAFIDERARARNARALESYEKTCTSRLEPPTAISPRPSPSRSGSRARYAPNEPPGRFLRLARSFS